MSYKELVDLMEQAEGEVENRKEQAIKELRAQFDQKLFEMGVSIRELIRNFPVQRMSNLLAVLNPSRRLCRNTAIPKTTGKPGPGAVG